MNQPTLDQLWEEQKKYRPTTEENLQIIYRALRHEYKLPDEEVNTIENLVEEFGQDSYQRGEDAGYEMTQSELEDERDKLEDKVKELEEKIEELENDL